MQKVLNSIFIVVIVVSLFWLFTQPNTFGARVPFPKDVKSVIFNGNVITYNDAASKSFSSTDLCDYDLIRYNAYGGGDDVGASLSFPSSASMIASCLRNTGSSRFVGIENIATNSGRDIEFNESEDYDLYLPTIDKVATLSYNEMGLIRFTNINGTSVSYEFIRFTTGD